jgi:hypothetical protein
MAFVVGPDRAKQLGDAHELATAPGDHDLAIDREMDLHNNEAGRKVGVMLRGQGAITRALGLANITAAGLRLVDDGRLLVLDQRARPWRLVPSNTDGID